MLLIETLSLFLGASSSYGAGFSNNAFSFNNRGAGRGGANSWLNAAQSYSTSNNYNNRLGPNQYYNNSSNRGASMRGRGRGMRGGGGGGLGLGLMRQSSVENEVLQHKCRFPTCR